MSTKEIHELYYSNGIDVFGPVNTEEFSRNKYYKNTLIWHDGLDAWIKIGDCAEFKHLIGSLNSAYVDEAVPETLSDITPPLTKVISAPKSKSGLLKIAILLGLILIVLSALLFNSKFTEKTVAPVAADTTAPSVAEDLPILEAEKKTYRLNWQSFILAGTNAYRTKPLGGIEDLKIHVQNKTPYLIDSVIVQVSYVRSNGEVYQKEILHFDAVNATSEKELFAPDSPKGVKVYCSILSVTSKEMDLFKQVD